MGTNVDLSDCGGSIGTSGTSGVPNGNGGKMIVNRFSMDYFLNDLCNRHVS